MPRRRRRRWISFKKKVDYIADKKQGLKSLLFNSVETHDTIVDQSSAYTQELYSVDGRTDHRDLGQISRAILSTAVFDAELDPVSSGETSKLVTFESASIECVLSNTGTTPIILEVYHWRCRKDTRQTGQDSHNNPWGYYDLGFRKQPGIEDPDTGQVFPGSTLSSTLIGTTPFQSSIFCSHFQILRREKFTIQPGASIQKSLRIPFNKTINIGDLRSLIARRNLTEGFLFQQQGAPGYTGIVPHASSPSSLVMYTVRRYGFYLRAGGFDQDAIIAS